MARKTKIISQEQVAVQEELYKIQDKLLELEELNKQAKLEEEELLKSVKEKIDSLCAEHNLYCGVILTFDNIVEILRLMNQTKENVKISYNLYFNEI